MLFAHEMTHVWQWQNRDRTGYTPGAPPANINRAMIPICLNWTASPIS